MNKKFLLFVLVLFFAATVMVFAASVSRDGVTITYTSSSTELTLFQLYNNNSHGVWVTFFATYSNNSTGMSTRIYVGPKQNSVNGFQPYPVRSVRITGVERASL